MSEIAEGRGAVAFELWSALRKCQRESVKCALDYTAAVQTVGTKKSCLISLPTGAGKTGVIAVVAHYADQKKTLVLCHRSAVRDQLFKEIGGRFFAKTCPNIAVASKKVFDQVDDISATGVYVSTFQKLNVLSAERLALLKNEFDLIIIDEGHSEPSPVWQTLVRGSMAHKIVVTATPYRNDLFQFDVSVDFSYIYTFSNAVDDGVVSEPIFSTVLDEDISQEVLDFLINNPKAKCIIKCKTFEKVEEYFGIFDAHSSILAVHERYKNDPRPNAKTHVPASLEDSGYRILIHQHKLDEGVDIPSAKLLILTYVLGSGRELVQSIGRVVRVSDNLRPLVLELKHAINSTMWMSYRDFDRSLKSSDGVRKFLTSLDSGKLIELYLDAFPQYSYHENRFVGKFDINTFDPDVGLCIPTASMCFFYASDGFAIQQAADTVYWRSSNKGELCKIFKSTSSSVLTILSITFSRSRFLASELFFEPRLEITLLKELCNGLVAIYDSRGRAFGFDRELRLGAPLEQDRLLKVMTLGSSMRPKEASTRSINSARRRPEAIQIKGPNLNDLGGQQQNSAYRMSTIMCDTYDSSGKKSGSYYVGVDSGRISDRKEGNFSLGELEEWFLMIETCLASPVVAKSSLLNSFAKAVKPPHDYLVESVVLDFSEFEEPQIIIIEGCQVIIDNSFSFYRYDNGFYLKDGLAASKVTLTVCDDAPWMKVTTHGDWQMAEPGIQGFAKVEEFLRAGLHKVLFSGGITYSGGHFYELRLPSQDGFLVADSDLANVLVSVDGLRDETLTEKGDVDRIIQTVGDEFSKNSVFHLIDKLKNYSLADPLISDLGPFYSYIKKPDYMLCADMGTEPADFIVSSPDKLVYVHVKCGNSATRPESSAGALAEVGSQAIKNLEMLISSDQTLKAANWNSLLNDWPDAGAPQRLTNRIRLLAGNRYSAGTPPVEQALQQFWDVIATRRKSLGVKKEIWIVAANSFSRNDFNLQMGKGVQARSESLQAYQLIQSWLSSASALDAELRIFVTH